MYLSTQQRKGNTQFDRILNIVNLRFGNVQYDEILITFGGLRLGTSFEMGEGGGGGSI